MTIGAGHAGVNVVRLVHVNHSAAFDEILQLVVEALEKAGAPPVVSQNKVLADRVNLLVGTAFRLKAQEVETLVNSGAPYVVFQGEVLDAQAGFAREYGAYVELLKGAAQVWDYSAAHVEYLRALGCRDVRHMPLGYAQRLERIVPAVEDIDVLFYGMTSPRRIPVLEELRQRGVGLQVVVGLYGQKRDALIARSKVVINIHQFDVPQLEQARLAYLLNNRRFVVSERGECDPYAGGVVYCGYEELVEMCVKYLGAEMAAERARVAAAGYAALQRVPMAEKMREALAALGV